jgi:hypothetical protein
VKGAFRTEEKYSKTTTKHINSWFAPYPGRKNAKPIEFKTLEKMFAGKI